MYRYIQKTFVNSIINNKEWLDLKKVVEITEEMCRNALNADVCNWNCLMNDAFKSEPPMPHLHFHIRPRFKKLFRLGEYDFSDDEFGHHYQNHKEIVLTNEQTVQMFELYRKWIDNFLDINKNSTCKSEINVILYKH